jgi:hypothetical protein
MTFPITTASSLVDAEVSTTSEPMIVAGPAIEMVPTLLPGESEAS